MITKDPIIEIATDVALVVLPLNLLNLFFKGAWQEVAYILYPELIILCMIIALGCYRIFLFLSKLARG